MSGIDHPDSSQFCKFRASMKKDKVATTLATWDEELALLENLRWSRKEFVDRVCASSQSADAKVLGVLRLEATYQLAEFYFLLRARGIETEADIERLAELHNQYVVDIMKDAAKMDRLGISRERALESMFTADTMPRLLQHWRESVGAIDQSNLARLLMSVMSTETCRKVVVACAESGFLERKRTPYGTVLVFSNGTLETIFGNCLRDLRMRITDRN
ncbi:hypothetical protein LJR220_001737 [Bradyrhizobium sp. LjRoot220]|uniref:hypothetical protein n=1 Tax=Bradyrhizobium sp. LjRoot220 TaxID=3342284 RepID=UPI003ECD8433